MSEISVRLPDGNMLKVPQGSAVLDVAAAIGRGLAKACGVSRQSRRLGHRQEDPGRTGRSPGNFLRPARACGVNKLPLSLVVGEKEVGVGSVTSRLGNNQKKDFEAMALDQLVGQRVENTNARRTGPLS